MSYHAPRPVHLSFVYVTAHEKVPQTKKGDDGALLLRQGALIAYMVPYHAPRPVRLSFVYVTAHEKYRRRRRAMTAYYSTSKNPDEVYSALSCAAPCSPTHRPRHGTREGTGDEEGRRRRTTATSRSPDDVYGALSCAAYKLRISFCCQV